MWASKLISIEMDGGEEEDQNSSVDNTHPDLLVLSPSGEVLPILTEAHTSDVQVARFACCLIHEHATRHQNELHEYRDTPDRHAPSFLPGLRVVDLGSAVAPCREELAVCRKADTTYNTGNIVNPV